MKYIFPKLVPSIALALLVGCGGGSDSGQENTPGTPPDSGGNGNQLVYNGPTAATDDVLQFKLNLWDNLAADNRCGGCHNDEVGQEPIFMHRSDINLAYEATLPLVDKQAPVLSRLVERAAENHNAWDPSAADTIQNLIQRWATATGASENIIVLTVKSVRPANSRSIAIFIKAPFGRWYEMPVRPTASLVTRKIRRSVNSHSLPAVMQTPLILLRVHLLTSTIPVPRVS